MSERAGGEPIAIVGLGCVLPDALDIQAFWNNVLSGRSALRPLGGPRWERIFDPDPDAPDRTYSLIAACVDGFRFDWRRFRMPPAEAEIINPMQLMVLEAGVTALDEARELDRESTGIVIGSTGLGWQRDSGLRIRMVDLCDAVRRSSGFADLPAEQRERVLGAARAAIDARLMPVSEDNVVNAAASVAAGRIAMQRDLRGLHYAVDAGFASSLAALEQGVRLLRDRTLSLALVGGVSELLTPLEMVAFAKLGGLAKRRVCPFDEDADGTLLGEGVVMFALRRLEDAERAGDTIYAVVRGVGASSDGGGRALCAPRPEGQALAMRRAYEDAGLDPGTVGLVECHATGTPVGDLSEVLALKRMFPRERGLRVALGSAKPYVGHLRAGSGAVGLLRAVLALRARTVPAQLGFRRARPELELQGSPFFVPETAAPLAPQGGGAVPRAGVSSFGFGGTDFHAVIEAYEAAAGRTTSFYFARPDRDEPIAIVGMGGRFPGAADVPALWRMLLEGRDQTREVPKERWDVARYFNPDRDRRETCYTRLGCFLDELPGLEARWRIPPAGLPSLDAAQLLMLLAAEEALKDAGLEARGWDRDRVGVMLGFLPYQGKKFLADLRINCGEFLDALSLALREERVAPRAARRVVDEAEALIKEGLPPITEDTLTGYLGSINAARISSHFGFRGPHFTVDAACASSHAALLSAALALRQRVCDAVIAGGTWCDMMPEFYIAACRFQALSARGSTPFGAGADGFVPGEGASAVVLRRLSDAERAGERIHAIIRALAGSSDGRGRSVLAPSAAGEARAMERALTAASLKPGQVPFVECHGTGTALGDKVEVEACTLAYGKERRAPLLIGSVKSNLGHLNAAAGMPALIKAALAVREGVIPPSLKADVPSPEIDFKSGPVQVVTRVTPFPAEAGEPRRAGVSSFGVGGINFHLIVEEHRAARARVEVADLSFAETAPLPLLTLAGPDLASCLARLDALCADLATADDRGLTRMLAAARRGPAPKGPYRVAIVALAADELRRRVRLLRGAAGRPEAAGFLARQGVFLGRAGEGRKVAVVFPGQGPHYRNMLREAGARFAGLMDTLAECDRIYEALCGRPLTPSFLCDEDGEQRDEDMHCAVFAVSIALFRLLRSFGLRPSAVMGQSAGELAALVAAGVLALPDGLRAMRERTLSVLSIDTADPGRMVALALPASAAREMLSEVPGPLCIAADNSPAACIVAGARAAVDALVRRCQSRGINADVLAVSHAYHSQLIAPALPRYQRFLEGLSFSAPMCEVVSTITGASIRSMPAGMFPAHLARQYTEPVRLSQAIHCLHEAGARLFIECGPKWSVTHFITQTLGKRPHLAQATIHPKIGEVEQLCRALACLFVEGALEAPLAASALEGEREALPPSIQAPAEPGPAPLIDEAMMTQDSTPTRDEMLALLRSIQGTIGALLGRCEPDAAGPPAPSLPPVAVPAEVPAQGAAPVPPAPASAAPPAPSPASPAPPSGVERSKEVQRVLLSRLADKTGYPEEMLELDLDLEGDLGIDTVKQVAIVAEVRQQLGLLQDPEFKLRDHNTLRKLIDYLVAKRWPDAVQATEAPAPAPADARPAVEAHAAQTGLIAQPAAVAQPAPPDRKEEVRRVLLARVVDKTGYPEDMLELDLDLEADLGVDTVKQVAIIAEARQRLGLPPDPQFKLREHSTLRRLIGYLAEKLAPCEAPPAPPEPPGDVTLVLERGRPGAGGALSGSMVPEARCLHFLLAAFGARQRRGRLCRLEQVRFGEPAYLDDEGRLVLRAALDEEAGGRVRARVHSSSVTHVEGVAVFSEDPLPPAPGLEPGVLASLRKGERQDNGMALLTATRRGVPSAGSVIWAWGSRFDEVVGGLRLSQPTEDPAEACLAELVMSAFWLSDFGWYGLSGAVHSPARLSALRLFRVPAPGEELLLHVRLLPPEAGCWGADVNVVAAGAMDLVAVLEGLRGAQASRLAGALGAPDTDEDAAVSWQRFYRRMQEPRARGEEQAW